MICFAGKIERMGMWAIAIIETHIAFRLSLLKAGRLHLS